MGSTRNGRRRPPRARIELVTPAPSAEEAAAISAAIEQFLAEAAPAIEADPSQPQSAWQRAAIREGVHGRDRFGTSWGGPGRLG